ncbi:MAG: hypothetical protein DRN05_00775 [Thermoplasmata archaeon]|nr:MAG: hypothetical protein DRN05_00775 [Thermoplasmata archaeon]
MSNFSTNPFSAKKRYLAESFFLKNEEKMNYKQHLLSFCSKKVIKRYHHILCLSNGGLFEYEC